MSSFLKAYTTPEELNNLIFIVGFHTIVGRSALKVSLSFVTALRSLVLHGLHSQKTASTKFKLSIARSPPPLILTGFRRSICYSKKMFKLEVVAASSQHEIQFSTIQTQSRRNFSKFV